MTRAVHRAGFRPLAFASRHLLLRPAALKIAASIVLTLLALGLYSLSRGSYPLPASTLARALLAPQEMGEQPRFILFDIRLPRILMALLCGAMLGLAGAAMQSITRNGLADPGLIGVKEGASIVVLALVLFFPAVGLVWRPLAGMVGGIAVALLVLTLARDCSRPRFILIGIGVSSSLAAAVGIFMTTADVRDADGDDPAGGQPAGRHRRCWRWLFAGRCPGPSSCSVPPGRRTWRCWATGPPSASAYVCSS